MPPKELNFITGNKHKLAEVSAILGSTVHLRSQSLDLLEIQGTIEEISTDKCKRAAETVSGSAKQMKHFDHGEYAKLTRDVNWASRLVGPYSSRIRACRSTRGTNCPGLICMYTQLHSILSLRKHQTVLCYLIEIV